MYTNTYHVPELAKTWVHSSEQNLGPSEGDALSDSLQRADVQVEENVSTGGGTEGAGATSLNKSDLLVLGQALWSRATSTSPTLHPCLCFKRKARRNQGMPYRGIGHLTPGIARSHMRSSRFSLSVWRVPGPWLTGWPHLHCACWGP